MTSTKTYTLTEKQILDYVEARAQEFANLLIADLTSGEGPSVKAKLTTVKTGTKAGPARKVQRTASEELSLKERIQKVVNAKKSKAQSYYDVDSGKAYVLTNSKKKTHDFYELGEGEDKLFVMGLKTSEKTEQVLSELDFEGAEPLSFEVEEKPLPKKKVQKKTVPSKPETEVESEPEVEPEPEAKSEEPKPVPSKPEGKTEEKPEPKKIKKTVVKRRKNTSA